MMKSLKAVQLTKELTLGNTENNTFMGPVINQKQFDKIKNYIEIGKDEGQLEQGGALMIQQVTSLNQLSSQVLNLLTVSCMKKIFGPVVGFIKVDNFDEAIDVANDTEYRLNWCCDY